jgi:hypothetical protein
MVLVVKPVPVRHVGPFARAGFNGGIHAHYRVAAKKIRNLPG